MINITLKQEQETFIQEKLNSGQYNNIDEIITEALLLLQQKDKNYQQWIKETQRKLNIGIEQLDAGQGIDSEIVINRLKNKINNLH
ncbi:type II toxin-antitoxin system ParD family antitoxin [Crocosphaera sp.]|uniref:ribbon-helix-helix domain-containing protein n=1 Tax=Crocosphaera sp. TaxID=2729996 RepID=UPI00260F18E9|nr:type II toxin-antitoxin system ParD family antitoxin [Crocosphaera sp.]MDJ0581049.1 type II toxin-antitoxin system ParD family antitoxin [Crocosphaera sp.]